MIVIYDGDCPFCDDYVRLMKIEDAVEGPIKIVNARSDAPEAIDARARYDMDEGMLVIHGGKDYYGAEALALLSSLEQKDNRFADLLRPLGSSRLASAVYPLLKLGRRAALIALGRPPIPKEDLQAMPGEQSGAKEKARS